MVKEKGYLKKRGYLYDVSKHSLQIKKAKDIKGGCKVKSCIAPVVSDGVCLEHRAIIRLQEERSEAKLLRKIEKEQAEMKAAEPRSGIWVTFVSGGLPK